MPSLHKVLNRVFHIGVGEFLSIWGGDQKISLGIFYQVAGTWGERGVILTIQTFFKAKNNTL